MGHLDFQCVRSKGEPFLQASDQGTPLTVLSLLAKPRWIGRTEGKDCMTEQASQTLSTIHDGRSRRKEAQPFGHSSIRCARMSCDNNSSE